MKKHTHTVHLKKIQHGYWGSSTIKNKTVNIKAADDKEAENIAHQHAQKGGSKRIRNGDTVSWSVHKVEKINETRNMVDSFISNKYQNITEISAKKLGSYIKKATQDVRHNSAVGAGFKDDKMVKKGIKRSGQISKATDKLVNKVNENWDDQTLHKTATHRVRKMVWTGEGKDKGYTTYQVDEFKKGHGCGWITTTHRSLETAKKKAKIKEPKAEK